MAPPLRFWYKSKVVLSALASVLMMYAVERLWKWAERLWRFAVGWQRRGGQQRRARRRRRRRNSLGVLEGSGLGRLPLHLQTDILARLPLRKVLELRAVCWSWNMALRSRALLEHVQDDGEGWLLMAREVGFDALVWSAKELLAYIPLEQRFFPFPGLPHMIGPAAARVATAEGPFDYPTALDFALRGASDCGLLCCLVNRVLPPGHPLPAWRDPDFSLSSRGFLTDTTGYSVIVFNPLTGALRCLPSPPMSTPTLYNSQNLRLSIHPHDDGTHYSVALFESPYHYDHLEIYDSRTQSWKVAQPSCAAQNGTLLSFAQGEIFYRDFMEGWLFSYNLQQEVWCKISMPMDGDLPAIKGSWFLSQASVYGGGIVRCGHGRILKATPFSLGLNGNGYAGFVVYELETSQGVPRWMPLSYTPEELWQCHQHLVGLSFYFSCATDGKLICMTGRASSDGEDRCVVPLVYNLARDLWYFLPGDKDCVALSAFKPSLKAHPLPPLITRSSASTVVASCTSRKFESGSVSSAACNHHRLIISTHDGA